MRCEPAIAPGVRVVGGPMVYGGHLVAVLFVRGVEAWHCHHQHARRLGAWQCSYQARAVLGTHGYPIGEVAVIGRRR